MSASVAAHKLRCQKCGEEWFENLLEYVAIKVWIEHVRSIRCPKCGADSNAIAFVVRPAPEAEPGQ